MTTKYEIMHIDTLANICGFFNSDTFVNNHYGCDHPDCEETELLIKKNGGYEYAVGRFDQEFRVIARKMLGRKTSNRRKVKKAIKNAQLIEFDNSLLSKLGLKRQGMCYDYSCPLCFTADEECCKENGIEYEHDWVVVEVELLKELEK